LCFCLLHLLKSAIQTILQVVDCLLGRIGPWLEEARYERNKGASSISERPLDHALFLPPRDFERVQELPPSIFAPPELKAGQQLASEPLDYHYPLSVRVRLHWAAPE
jgi:hypothetical protein